MTLTVALLMFTLAVLGTTTGTVLYFRSDTQSLRKEIESGKAASEQARISDRAFIQLQLDTIVKTMDRVEQSTADIARAVNAARRLSDLTTGA